MKYSKFTVTNYKGIPKITLDLDRKPETNIFTLVGLNESGKTSILEAIHLFHEGIEKENAHTLIPKSQQHSFSDTVSVVAELTFSADEITKIKKLLESKYKFLLTEDFTKITVTEKYSFKDSIPVEEKWEETLWSDPFVGKTKQAKSTKKLNQWNSGAWGEVIELIHTEFLPTIIYYPDFLFKFPEKIYLEKFEGEGQEQEEYRGVIQDVLNSVGTNLTIEKDLLERMRNKDQESYSKALSQLLLKMSAKLDNEILKKWDEIFGSGQKKEVEIDWGNDVAADGITARHFVKLEIKQGSDEYSINDRSLGFRWFFSFLIFTAFRQSRTTDPGETLFLLDEPASNLHQRSQQKLLQSLSDIVSNSKLIYSTHSHHLINPKWLAGAYIVKNAAINYGNPEESDTTETDISATLYKNFVAKYPDEEDHFKPILDALQYTPSNLEIVPSTVFTEGKNDYYTFKYFAEIILKDKYKLHFYPGAGVDKYADVFRLYLAWNRNFVTMFDSDKAGTDSQKRYIEEIGPDVSGKIFTLQNVDPKWKKITTEDLFSDTEKLKVIQACFENHKKEEGYVKSKFNTAVQELYIGNRPSDFNATTVAKFEKIFKYISEKLK